MHEVITPNFLRWKLLLLIKRDRPKTQHLNNLFQRHPVKISHRYQFKKTAKRLTLHEPTGPGERLIENYPHRQNLS